MKSKVVASSRPFNAGEFDDELSLSFSSAKRLIPILLHMVPVRSVIDFGCGAGAWLAAFEIAGIEHCVGIEGGDVNANAANSSQITIYTSNLEHKISLGERFDLAISLEVGEHLRASAADNYIASIAGHSDLVLFSAAVPGQGGLRHVNEQWPQYWASLFAQHGYFCYDVLRDQIWNDAEIAFWYRQNVLLFASGEAAHAIERQGHKPSNPRALVHPCLFEQKVNSRVGSVRESFRDVAFAARRAVRIRMQRRRQSNAK